MHFPRCHCNLFASIFVGLLVEWRERSFPPKTKKIRLKFPSFGLRQMHTAIGLEIIALIATNGQYLMKIGKICKWMGQEENGSLIAQNNNKRVATTHTVAQNMQTNGGSYFLRTYVWPVSNGFFVVASSYGNSYCVSNCFATNTLIFLLHCVYTHTRPFTCCEYDLVCTSPFL